MSGETLGAMAGRADAGGKCCASAAVDTCGASAKIAARPGSQLAPAAAQSVLNALPPRHSDNESSGGGGSVAEHAPLRAGAKNDCLGAKTVSGSPAAQGCGACVRMARWKMASSVACTVREASTGSAGLCARAKFAPMSWLFGARPPEVALIGTSRRPSPVCNSGDG